MSTAPKPPDSSIPPLPRGSVTPDAPPVRGELIAGRYLLQEPLGEGGTGAIFRAIQIKVQRPLAVKFLKPDAPGQQTQDARFEREAMALAALCHPNIVRLQDYGTQRGTPYLVMELVDGRTLRELLASEGPLSITRALSFTRQILHALAYAHDMGLVHRDLKPANIAVQALPHQPEHVKVLDFGFVKFLPGSELDTGAQLTRMGFTYGSPAYMSPEHATGGQVDGRADLYSVGIMLFEMLTNTRPFEGEINELLRHHLASPVPRLAERRPELGAHPELQQLLDLSLEKKRDERFPDAAAFLAAIDALLLPAGKQAARQAMHDVGDDAPTMLALPRMTQPGTRPGERTWLATGGQLLRALLSWLLSGFALGQQQWTSRVWPALVRDWPWLAGAGDKTTAAVAGAWQNVRPTVVKAVSWASAALAQLVARLSNRGQKAEAAPVDVPPAPHASSEPSPASPSDVSPEPPPERKSQHPTALP